MTHVTIHYDAVCPQDNSAGGFAAILAIGSHHITIKGGHPSTTAHQMHLTTLTHALRVLAHHRVEPDTMVILSSGPTPATNVIQNAAPDPSQPDMGLQAQLLDAARPFTITLLPPRAVAGAPDLSAHCAAIATGQIDLTIQYQLPWSTASMALAPITQELPETQTDSPPPDLQSPPDHPLQPQPSLLDLLTLSQPSPHPETPPSATAHTGHTPTDHKPRKPSSRQGS